MDDCKVYQCQEVLELLSEFVDGTLSPQVVSGIKTHLESCHRCEQFGSEFGAMLQTIRQRLGAPAPLASEMQKRLRESLK